MYFLQPILRREQLQRLAKHQYSAESSSVLDAPLQHWWNAVVEWMPMWLAPNLITMVGLAINVATCAALMWACSPGATDQAPRLEAAACGVGLFFYQTLDAIDGKQARRTGSQSPLGELFDHGCDSLSIVFVVLATCCAVSLGHHPHFFLLTCFSASFLFYCAHWQAYVTGTVRFGWIDVTEAQMGVICIMLATAMLGPELWDMEVRGTELRVLPTVCACAPALWSLLVTLALVINGGPGKGGTSVADTGVLTPVLPMCLVLLPGVIIATCSPDRIFKEHPVLFIATWGIMGAKITNKLIVAHMSKSPVENGDVVLLVPAAFFLRYYCRLDDVLSEECLLKSSATFVTLDIVAYCCQVCREICQHLKVDLFKIKPKKPPKGKSATSNKE